MKKNIIFLLTTSIALVLASCGGGGGGGPTPQGSTPTKKDDNKNSAQASFDAASQAIEKTKRAIGNIKRRKDSDVIASLNQAQSAIQEVSLRQKDVEAQYETVYALNLELEAKRSFLEKQKTELEAQKKDLEQNQKFFSTGFFTSLGVLALTIAGAIVKLPTVMLDRKYRKLEILKKRVEIKIKRREVRPSYLTLPTDQASQTATSQNSHTYSNSKADEHQPISQPKKV